MAPPYVPGQSLAWLRAEAEGVRVHRAVVQSIERADDAVHWRVTTEWGSALVDDAGIAGNVLPIDVEIASEFAVHARGGSDYLVRSTNIDLGRELARHDALDHDQSIDLDDDLGLD